MSANSHTVAPAVILELISYNRTEYEKHEGLPAEELLTLLKPNRTNWINLDGLNNQDIIERIQAHFNLHSLLIDDVLSDQRPKAEEFDDYLFFSLKMLYRIEHASIDYEQISFVLGKDYLISFQEKEGDLFNGFRDRIRLDLGRVRKKEADYLMYRLIDIIVDNYYNVLDTIGDMIDDIEETIYEKPTSDSFLQIQRIKKELLFLRKAITPLRDAISKVVRGESEFVKEENIRFYADVYDHVVNLMDSVDMYKDLVASLTDMHINAMNTKLNEVIKVLTIISTIFIPLTFIVGVYGMNFDYMPELRWKGGYFGVWTVMLGIVIAMLFFFKRKKWF